MNPLSILYDGTNLRGDMLIAPKGPSILFLHGAGNSSRSRFLTLREKLHERGIGSAAFDHVGHGETGGELLGSSLAERTKQAQKIHANLPHQPSAFFGTSMGAYTAIKLAELFPVSTLILGVPGMYTPEAYHVSFGPEFSTILRQERSWESSDAFDAISRFPGRLLVIRATRDQVVPSEIPERLFSSAQKASHREMLDIDCDHQIMRHVNSDPQVLEHFADKLASFLSTA